MNPSKSVAKLSLSSMEPGCYPECIIIILALLELFEPLEMYI